MDKQETPKEVYALFVKVVKACTGLNETDAKYALSLHGVYEPEEKLELADVVSSTVVVTPKE